MNEILSITNLGVGAVLALVIGYVVRGLVDKYTVNAKANEEQVLLKAATLAMNRLAALRKPDPDAETAAMLAKQAQEAALVAKIKALQAKAASLS